MKQKSKILLITTVSFLSLILIFVLMNRLWNIQSSNELVVKFANSPENSWHRILQKTELPNKKSLLINNYDGYQFELFEDWVAPPRTNNILNIYSKQIQNRFTDEEWEDIVVWPVLDHADSVFTVYTFQNKEELLIDNWINTTKDLENILYENTSFQLTTINGPVHVAYQPIDEEDGDSYMQMVVLLSNKDKIYVITCSTVGDRCLETLQTFEMLN